MGSCWSTSERQRTKVRSRPSKHRISSNPYAEWEDAHAHIRRTLGLPEDDPTPKLPRPSPTAAVTITDHTNGTTPPQTDSKRKAPDADVVMDDAAVSKRPHIDGQANTGAAAASAEDTAMLHARTTAAYIPFLDADDLVPPKMPTTQEMEKFLLELRKRALVEEYFGEQES